MNFRNKCFQQLAMILLLNFFTLTSAAAPAWDGTMGMENGWPVVNNPMQSMEGDQTIAAEEIWRLGHEEDEQETIFGLIGDGLVDEHENTYLLDTILSTVYKVGPDGTILANLGGEGDGPGEFRNTQSMAFMPDGTLGIEEMMPGAVATIGRDGQPSPSFSYGDDTNAVMKHIARLAAYENGVVIGQTMAQFGDDQVMTSVHSLACYNPDGSVKNLLLEKSEKQSGGAITLGGNDNDFTRFWSLGFEGRVVVFQENQDYKLEVYGADGKPEMLIRRQYKPVRRSDEEIEQDKRLEESLRQRFTDMEARTIPTLARHISAAFSRPNGDLWVQNSQGDKDCPENSIGYFDVFNTDGHYVKRILIEADYDPQRDNFRLQGNHLLVFKEAQKAPERTTTSGGGGMSMVMVSGVTLDEDDDDEEPRPYEVVFYRLP